MQSNSSLRFTDLSSIGSPSMDQDDRERDRDRERERARKPPRKRGGNKPRLSPLDQSGSVFDSTQALAAAGVKPRRIAHKKDLAEAVRKIQLNPHPELPIRRQDRKIERSEDAPEEVSGKSELEALEDNVNNNARRFNDLKSLADRREGELAGLRDELRDLRNENDELRRLRAEQTQEGSTIMTLKRSIERTTEEMDEKIATRRQLEHMVARLEKNQMRFDAHINGMEDTLRSVEGEYETVTLLLRQLDSGKAEAFHDLQRAQLTLEQQRRARERVMREKSHEANNAKKMEKWREEREAQRQELAAELRGDLSHEQQEQLQHQLSQQEQLQHELRQTNKERSAQALTLEEAFMQIRQATGVNTLQEMLSKFMGQGANRAALEEEKQEAEDRLSMAKARKEEVERSFAELKASGIGGTELNREIYEQLNGELSQARVDLKVNSAACERLEGVLVAMRQGALGLTQRLQPFASLLTAEDEANMPATQNQSLRMLHLAEAKLTKMMEVISGDNGASTRFGHIAALGDDDEDGAGGGLVGRDGLDDSGKPWTPLSNEDPALSQNNVRVHSLTQARELELTGGRTPRSDGLPAAAAAGPGGAGSGAGGGAGGGGGPGGPGGAQAGGQVATNASAAVAAAAAAAAAAADSDEDDDENSTKPMQDIVPSRSFLKLSSQRQFSETMRKREQAERRKAAMDKMLDENGERLPLTTQAARKKRQAAASKRLSDLPNLSTKLGLPPGLTLKSDAMTRTHVFLTQRPELL